MTVQANEKASAPLARPADGVTVTIDGFEISVPRGTLVIRAAEQLGIQIPRFCDHPLDCPMCDKGGECPLQNQAMSSGQGETRFTGTKRDFAKPVALSAQVLLDRERCVQCARCTRFADQVAGDPLIELLDRGPSEQVGIADGVPFDSYFSGNTVQICPVGALTS